ncbi:PATAN domain-containing protein [Desulfuromonas versatilis]|uniref:PATAN domain-containing protein n=1 Tax=Desulfuromonas versatilis TaxID=2802975 RepID=A0ABN6DWJ9_9BACT|nr:DUF4388 domain-containing protein [Desulfuromonas versatilis]BCR04501.1 PATAN domain-containing protein [Desulfuromonas versatilis]
MILLPRGNPVKEQIDPGKVNLPSALQKLQAGKFTGYLRFDASSGTGIIIFQQGKLVSALVEEGKDRLIAYDALARIFDLAFSGGTTLDIYRLSPELAVSIHALLHGEVLYRGQELKLIDIRMLLGKFKEERLTGCLRIYTQEHIALIFYRDGSPLGFFHDGSTEIETTADTSMSVARQPGAKVDVLTTRVSADRPLADLMQSADIAGLWQKAREKVLQARQSREEEASRVLEQKEKERRQRILALFHKLGQQHLGKIGGSLVEKEFEKKVAGQGPVSEKALDEFFAGLGKSAKLVAGPSAINNMLEEMKKGLKGLLGG